MRTKCILFGKALRIRLKECKQNLSKSHLKSTKIAIRPTACKFSKFSGGACPRTLLEFFSFLNQLQISSAEKKYAGKNVENYAFPLLKVLSISLWATGPMGYHVRTVYHARMVSDCIYERQGIIYLFIGELKNGETLPVGPIPNNFITGERKTPESNEKGQVVNCFWKICISLLNMSW